MRGILIPADPTKPVSVVEYDGSIEALQALVGGYIEYVPVRDQALVPFCNEEGKLMGLDANERATRFMLMWDAPAMLHGDVIVGDMLLTGVDHEGETIDVPATYEEICS